MNLSLSRIPPALLPLAGGVLGAIGAGIYLPLSHAMPISIVSALVLLFWIAATRAQAEQGLAATAGSVAMVLAVLIRWQALEYLPSSNLSLIPVMVASQAVPRAATIVLAWITRPVVDATGSAYSERLTRPAVWAAVAQGLAATFWCGALAAVWMIAAMSLLIYWARRYFEARLGGIKTESAGAVQVVAETLILLIASCRDCI